ncbi:2'-5' RNA ligase family protein [Verrucosispora sp. TAA-831]|uniref:2'-5' RNA ligase family protein n=1 Tax=Verrucosispora sp. TAA-831 TaxID=3422227 RepID=UPI003D6ED3AC
MPVELARRPGVELVRTGTWDISTGRWKAAREDLAAAVAALSCPAIGKPIIKIGHRDTRFTPGDGEPAIGWYDNLRLTDGGHTLVGDQVAPAWLTSVQAAAWPNRSVEGEYRYRCGLGHTHPFVLTAVALLGVTPPGVATLSSLNDVQQLFGVAAGLHGPVGGGVKIAASVSTPMVEAAAEVHTGAMVALIPTADDAARLAVDGGEPAEELHVTLAYLGAAADLSAEARQDIIDAVSAAINGAPEVQAEAFALSVFNPPGVSKTDGRDRDACIVLGLSGDLLDAIHTLVNDALNYADVPMPQQHAPWHAHLTLTYTDDLDRLRELVDRIGPVRFDRLRIALGGQHIDIPLIGEPEPDEPDDAEQVAAAARDENSLRTYFTRDPEGLKRWAKKRHPWTSLYRIVRKHVGSERAKRIATSWFFRVFGYYPGDRRHRNRKVAATGAATPTHGGETTVPNPDPSLAERIHQAWNASSPPEQQWIVEAGDDEVIVIDNSDRSLSRIAVTVDGDAISFGQPTKVRPAYVPVADPAPADRLVFASADESRPLAPPADPAAPEPTQQPGGPATEDKPAPTDPGGPTPTGAPPAPKTPAAEPEPNTEKGEDPVSTLSTELLTRLGLAEGADEKAALAAIDVLKTQAEQAPVQVAAAAAATDEMKGEIGRLSGELAEIRASAAASAKTALFERVTREGRIKPADRKSWENRYDKHPEVITEILASIAPQAAVPTALTGQAGSGDEIGDVDSEYEAMCAAIDGPTGKGV